MRVLIVEDDVDLAEVLAEEVSELGHEVHVVRSGQEAIAAAAHFAADVALVDVVLPDINGMTLASVLRGLVEHDHMAKPVTPAELRRALSLS